MIKSLEFFFSFFQSYNKCYISEFFFRFSRISFNLARTFAVSCEALFLPFLKSLLITY